MGTFIYAASGNTFLNPLSIALAASKADILSLKESGAITIFISFPPFVLFWDPRDYKNSFSTPNTSVDATANVKPTSVSYGINFMRSFKFINTLPPVAWKKLPSGKWSNTVAPAWTIAAPASPATPSSIIVDPNTFPATTVPAVVDAVAMDMNAPEKGANK